VVASDLEVRSYRAVFSLERRIYRIDRLRLNPAGVPLRGIVYGLALAAGALLTGSLPGISWAVVHVPWYFRDIALPAALAGLFAVLRIDGRPFHTSAAAMLRHRLGARHLRALSSGARPASVSRLAPVVFLADGSEGSLRALRYHGPGAALVCYPHERVEWSRGSLLRRQAHLSIHPVSGVCAGTAPVALELAAGAVLEVSPRPWPGRSGWRD